MTSKDRLRQYRYLETDIEAKIEQRAKLRALLNRAGDREELRQQYDETDEHICRQLERLFAEQREIRDAISRMEDKTLAKLLEYRYINGWSLKRISYKMYISYDWLRHLHGVALTRIQFDDAHGHKR